MVSKVLLFLAVFCVAVIRGTSADAKICYQCDELNPSSKWKFWGEKITKCSGIPFEKYATKTSKAFGSAVLTCYTKFNEQGAVIKRAAYGFGEVFDKTVKCRDRYHLCCRSSLCNKHTASPCPPPPKVEPKGEVKACYECKGVEACQPQNLPQNQIRTSAVLGASNLYCFTNLILKQVKLLLVVVSDLVKFLINILNAMLNIIDVVMKIYVIHIHMVIVHVKIMLTIVEINNNKINNKINNKTNNKTSNKTNNKNKQSFKKQN